MSTNSAQLSKSSLIRSIQCAKSLYLYKHHYNLRNIPDVKQQQKFDRGIRVGKLAQQLFPNGKDCTPPSHMQYAQSIAATKLLIAQKQDVIYEAAFKHQGILVALDILVCKDGKYFAYEVKSSPSVSNTYILDCAIQYYIIKKCGIEIEDFFIIYVNDSYIRNGDLDIQQFFIQKSILNQVLEQQEYVLKKIQDAIDVIHLKTMPDIKIGAQCNKPYPCDFKNYCWKDVPQNSIWYMQGIPLSSKIELIEQGITTIDAYALKQKNNLLLNSYRLKSEIVDKDNIKSILKQIKFPVAFFDVEAFQSAIPIFNGTKPYERMPFLYSLHTLQHNDANLEHQYYLSKTDEDNRLPFLIHFLESTKNVSTILVFNELMEKGILNYLANKFPTYKPEIDNRIEKIIDIEVIFKNQYYYHPQQLGSFSLKTISNAVLVNNPYQNINIKDGEEAMAIYNELFFRNKFEREKTYSLLIDYCNTDTYVLYLLYQFLLDKIKN
jgi:predicted RecB family nuclease